MQEVAVPPVKEGDDAKEKLAESRAALAKANGRIRMSRRFYETTKAKIEGAAK